MHLFGRQSASLSIASSLLMVLAACAPAAAPPAAAPPTSAPAAKPTSAPAAAPTTAAAPAAAAAAPTSAAAAKPTAATSAPVAAPAAGGTPDFPTGQITLRLWDTAEATKEALYKTTLIPDYQKLHPNVSIQYENISTPDMLQKLLVALSTGTGPEMFVLADWFMPTYFAKNLLDPVPPQVFGYKSVDDMVANYIPGRLEPFIYKGQLMAIPYQMNSYSLFINNQEFKDAGLDPVKDAPKTWEDVAKLEPKLTKKQGDRVTQKGFEMRYAGDNWLIQMFHGLVYQAGGDVLQDGKPVFNGEAGVKALNVWKSVTVAPQVTQNTGASPYQDFAVGQDAMMFGGPNASAFIEQINPAMKGNYTVVPLPQIDPSKPTNQMYSFNLTVNAAASADQKKVAWDFIHTEVAAKPTLWMQQTRMVNPLKGWFDTPEAKQVPFLDVFINELAIAKPMSRTDHFNELQSAVARAIQRTILEGMDPKQSLDQAAAEFTQASQ